MADILDKPNYSVKDSKQAVPQTTFGLATLNHFGISVRDLDRSVAFYRALTGGEPAGTGTWSSAGLAAGFGASGKATTHWATFKMNNVNIELFHIKEPDTPLAKYELGERGAMHAGFEVDDMEPVFKRMQDAGMKFYGPFHRVSREEDGAEEGIGTVVAFFDGPDGEKLELIAPQGPYVRKEGVAKSSSMTA